MSTKDWETKYFHQLAESYLLVIMNLEKSTKKVNNNSEHNKISTAHNIEDKEQVGKE